ncbi:MAG: SGNH/GDSL hydrolase family protein [Kiritimatiellae bacterium]|nr:SGNH/GDSL hydrolase family protein [Kiritimatiellia bacterium]
MKNVSWFQRCDKLVYGAAVLFVGMVPLAGAQGLNNLFFLHHSVGNNLIEQGNMRGAIQSYNTAHGTQFAFWDHGYNDQGLRNPSGTLLGTSYNIPGDNLYPDGLAMLWTSADADCLAARNLIMNNHQVIAFKSCYPTCHIPDQDTLNGYKTCYQSMRGFFDQHPEKLFIVMSPPPINGNDPGEPSNATEAGNARQFANWLKSSEYLAGHTNVVCFDLFNYLAGTDNFLKTQYCSDDSHPNEAANQVVGPILAQFFISSALSYQAGTNSPTPTNAPVPLIQANSTSGSITIGLNDSLSVTASLNPMDYAGTSADWWAAVVTPFGMYYYDYMGGNGWQAGLRPTLQGPLFGFNAAELLNLTGVPQAGTYTFYFGVDTLVDGEVTYDRLYFSSVEVIVTEN